MIYGCRWHNESSASHACSSTLSFEAEEKWARPSGSSNEPRNDRKAFVALPFVFEAILNDRDLVGLAVPLPQEASSGLDSSRSLKRCGLCVRIPPVGSSELFEMAPNLRFQAAVGLLLKLVREQRNQKLFANVWRRSLF